MGLRFESLADMPEGMREKVARQRYVEIVPGTGKPKSKYHAEALELNGIHFDSKKEAMRYCQLMAEVKAGAIRKLKLQPQYTLQESFITPEGERVRAIRYTADFVYERADRESGRWLTVVEDVKSKPTRTKEYLRNRKMMLEKFEIEVLEV